MAVIKMLPKISGGSGHAVALLAELADAGLAIGGSIEELEVEGLHGLLLGLGSLGRGRGGGRHPGQRVVRVYAGQESHISESCVPHIDPLLGSEPKESPESRAAARADAAQTARAHRHRQHRGERAAAPAPMGDWDPASQPAS